NRPGIWRKAALRTPARSLAARRTGCSHCMDSRSPARSASSLPGNGFTLVELLVVMAIVAVLSGILFPVCARVRESAHQASCASNLNQLGHGLRLYMQECDVH